MKRVWSGAIVTAVTAAVGVVATGSPAQAYCASPQKWARPGAVTVRPGAGIPTPWDAILRASAAQWTNISGSSFDIAAVARNFSGPIYGGGISHASNSSHIPQAPAITITALSGNTITSANTIFNPRWWFNDTGTFDPNSNPPKADVRTVLVHELGHWLKLLHPSQCGDSMSAAEIAASMNPNFTKKWNINADDKAGAAAMY